MKFNITEEMLNDLKVKDHILATVIEQVGMIERDVFEDVFEALVHAIVSQQISNAALETVWNRLLQCVGTITPTVFIQKSEEELRGCGLSLRKVTWLKEMSEKVINHEIDLDALYDSDDEEVIQTLMQFKGIGRWSAEMICIFALQRLNILSIDDLGIQKGICRCYGLESVSKEQGIMFKQRFAPYNTIASFYFWSVGNQKEWQKKDAFVL